MQGTEISISDILDQGTGIYIQEEFLTGKELSELISLSEKYIGDHFGTIRGLLDKSDVWKTILSKDLFSEACTEIFPEGAQLGSVDIKIFSKNSKSDFDKIYPHIDYPGGSVVVRDWESKSQFNNKTLALKFFIPITDMTLDNGATAYIPSSQNWNLDPENYGDLFQEYLDNGSAKRLLIPAGTLAIWNNRFWHVEFDNPSNEDKILLHICIVSNFVSPPHDLESTYGKELVQELNEKLFRS